MTRLHLWRVERGAVKHVDVSGLRRSVKRNESEGHAYVLAPGRYVWAEAVKEDKAGFEEKTRRFLGELMDEIAHRCRLDGDINTDLRGIGHGD